YLMTAVSVSNIIGSPLSGLIMKVHWLGIAGWRWMFILEGFPAIIMGIVTLFYLTDWPHQAKWLPKEEKDWLINELEQEKKTRAAENSLNSSHSEQTLRQLIMKILVAFKHREVVLLTLAYFFMVTGVYGLNFWIPSIIKKMSDLSTFQISLLSALPYCFGFITILLVGWHSDKTQERRWHTALSMMAASVGLVLSVVF